MQKRILATAALILVVSLTALAKGTTVYIYNVGATGITSTSATIAWATLVPASSQVSYGTTANYGSMTVLDPTLVSSHFQTISGLAPNTTYHYQVISISSSGTQYVAGDFNFTTLPNLVAGMISGLSVSSITGTSATITWTTNTPASSQVRYGTSANYTSTTLLNPFLTTSHSVTINQLFPNTIYHFSAQSVDAGGNYGISNDATFITTAGGAPTPITGVFLFLVTANSATINWSTSVPASSQIGYGITPILGSTTNTDPNLVTSHSVTINQLAPNTLYYYQAISLDGSGNLYESSNFTFTTPALSLFFPEMNLAANEYTGIGMVNFDQNAGNLNLTAFAGDGTLLSGSNVANPAFQTMDPGSQFGLLVNQILSSTSNLINWPAGWGVFNSADTNLGGFFLTFDSALTFQDGASLFKNPLASFVFPESLSQDFTKVILSNPNSGDASVTISLVKADGTLQGFFQTNIQGFATYSADLQSGIFQGIAIAPSDYLNVTSSVPLLPYEAFGNISKDISIVAGQDVNAGATTLYAPQYAVGGPENSLLSIVNLDSAPGNVTLKMFGGNGIQMGATQTLPIAVNGKIYIADPSFFLGQIPSQLTTGYVQVTSDGVHLSGDVVFIDALHGVFSAALPLVATLLQSQIIGHIASDATYYTGMALLNPSSIGANVTIQVYTAAGQLDQSTTLTLPAGNRTVQVLTQLFPALVGQARYSGYIKVTSDQALAAYGAFGASNLSILSAIPTVPVQ